MKKPKPGIRWQATVSSLVALAVTAIAFAVALTAATDSQRYTRDLSGRLVPAAAATANLLRLFTGQQASLRAAVTSGRTADLAPLQDAPAQFRTAAARVAVFAGGDQPLATALGATTAAYRRWQAGVTGPQVAALEDGRVTAAQALQANAKHNSPLSLAVRESADALSSVIIGEQQQVSDSLNRAYGILLGALIAMIVVVAVAAAGIVAGVWRGLLRPLRKLSRAVGAVADGSYHRAVPAVGPPELAELGHDIERMRTRLVTALNERERAEESQRSLFDLAPDAMVAIGSDGTIAMANARAGQVLGYPIGDLIGLPADQLSPPEWRDLAQAMNSGYLTDRRSRPVAQEVKAFGLRRDGTTFPSEVRLSWLPTERGTMLVAAIRDVSERLALEAERERLRVAAEQERFQQRLQQSRRLESLGQLVGGVAHDFNNLLSVIAGYADFTAEQVQELAAADERLEPVRADVERIRAAAQQAIRLTRQLLTFSRSDGAANREVLNLNELVKSSGDLLGRALGAQIELVITAEPDLWPVEADRGQVEQILVNLSVNARDAMPGGGRLTIGTDNMEADAAYAAQRPSMAPGRYCRLTVSDTGMGMDQATVERVFEPFFSTKPRGRGTGLGLATVYGIVSGLGGTIDIYSEPGLGTTMSVVLPAMSPSAPGERPGASAAELAAGVPAQDGREAGHGERILLVEDEAELRAMAGRLLTRNGYEVCAVDGGAAAVRLAEDPAERIDLLITDMIMPGMLGHEVAERVRAVRPRVPALFISGYAPQVLDFHGIPVADIDIVQKPFTEAALRRSVRQSLSKGAASAPARS